MPSIQDQYQQLIELLIQPTSSGFVEACKLITDYNYKLQFTSETDLNRDSHYTNLELIVSNGTVEALLFCVNSGAIITDQLLFQSIFYVQNTAQQPLQFSQMLNKFKLLVIHLTPS